MTRLARAFTILFIVLTFLLSIGLSFFNTERIAFSFGFFVLEPQPVALWVLSAFVIGGMVGLVLGAGLFRQWRSVREIQRLRAELQRIENERAAAAAIRNTAQIN